MQNDVYVMCLIDSIRYHQLNPDYIHERLKQLGNSFTVRILLVQVDVVCPLLLKLCRINRWLARELQVNTRM